MIEYLIELANLLSYAEFDVSRYFVILKACQNQGKHKIVTHD